MRKIFKLAKREYLAAVKTKGFIIGLIVFPIMMSGSGIGIALLKDRGDTTDQRIAVIDHSGMVLPILVEAVTERNVAIVDPESGKKTSPSFIIESVEPGPDATAQGLELSDRVRNGQLQAFVVIGPDVLYPGQDHERSRITYHSENSVMDEARRWISNPINNFLRRSRAIAAGASEESVDELFRWISVEGLSLVTVDESTGEVEQASSSNEVKSLLVPVVLVMLMWMMFMMSALPQLSAVMEEKGQRIAEVMLGSVTPFQFMLGKVLGGVGVSLTGILVYVLGGVLVINKLGYQDYIPYDTLPWFFCFLIMAITMYGSTFAALGSACNDAKEAQSLTFPAMMPMMVPMFILMPILQQPQAQFATILSLIPPFTPMIMIMRLASPISVPAWQPWVGLILVAISAIFAVWAGGRLFRVAILMQGTPPKIGNLLRWIIKG